MGGAKGKMDAVEIPAPAEVPRKRLASPHLELEEILDQHLEWLKSNGEAGQRADLSDLHLEDLDLTDGNLRKANLDKASLKGADLLLVDLRGASLLRANLRDTNLLGAKLQEADMQGSTLEGATGLLVGQLAGANLYTAELPAPISFAMLEGLRNLRAMSKRAGWLLLAFLVFCGLVWARIASVTDTQLIRNDSALPLAKSQTALPLIAFHLFGPILILVLFGGFHLYMQRMWDAAAAMPAVFPTGQRLDACLPWFARWAPQRAFRWLKERPSLAFIEEAAARGLLYWIVPATLIFFWVRYLTVQELRGSLLQAFLFVGASAAALFFPYKAAGTFRLSAPRAGAPAKLPLRAGTWARIAALSAIAVMLAALSTGVVIGVPHRVGRDAKAESAGMKSWAADVLWLAGYNPYAYLARGEISTKPANWSGQEEDLAGVKGARLDGRSLRFSQGYGAFFAKAHLWQADLQNAYLSEADLREANLRQAELQGAVLDRANLRHALLQQADLEGVTLTLADLREANLSFASLSGAILPDARMDGANLYKANLRNAILKRASVQGADLREVILEGADLTKATAREAYLDSAKLGRALLRGTEFQRAMLTDADLRETDLTEANLQGALLRGADFTGANLQGADFRGASGLNARQVCSAATLRLALFDDALAHDVDTTCPTKR